MLERYYALPISVERIRALWLGSAIERYAAWLAERGISNARARGCIEVLIQFDKFAQARGARDWSSLAALVDPFIAARMRGRRPRGRHDRLTLRSTFRVPVEQLLRLLIPGYVGTVRPLGWPLSAAAPEFEHYLRDERGLRWPTIGRYAQHLRALESYLANAGLEHPSQLTPRLITEFMTRRGRRICAGQLGAAAPCACSFAICTARTY